MTIRDDVLADGWWRRSDTVQVSGPHRKCDAVRNVRELFHVENDIGRYGDKCLGKSNALASTFALFMGRGRYIKLTV